MAHETLLTVDGALAVPAEPISMEEAKFWETKHLQQWMVEHPKAIAEGARVVAVEFNKWTTSAGKSIADRLDILAIDQTGRLIVVELKRDKAAGAVTMQAINYAAMVRRMSLDDLAEIYAAHLGEGTSPESALDTLREWAPELSDETLSPPRIVLMAGDFGPTITNTALFLVEQGIDLRLVRYQLYRLANQQLVLSVSQLIPVPEAEEFMVRPKSSPATQAMATQARTKNASIPERLVANELIAEGDKLKIVVPGGVAEDRETIRIWLSEQVERSVVTWRPDAKSPVIWAVDNKSYNLTGLIRRIIEQATGEDPRTQVWGPNWYQVNGVVLHQFVEQADKTATEGTV
ncbi:endonuclease NucS domain-containing protein [Plantactinospora solaniradicis]|uniref:Endonuclease NucS domain-containing protein n=1 Tax=Plantactinospora solaniradicis TaxID=1723736 RepID=A0ABW1K176_9ACTN